MLPPSIVCMAAPTVPTTDRDRTTTPRTTPRLSTIRNPGTSKPVVVMLAGMSAVCEWMMEAIAAIPQRLSELLGQPKEDALGAADVAEPVDVFILGDFVNELGAMGAQTPEDVIEVIDQEHDAADPQRVHGRVLRFASDRRRRMELVQFHPAVPVRRSQRRDFGARVFDPDDSVHPGSLDRHLALEHHPELDKESLRRLEVLDHDEHVVHPLKRHMPASRVPIKDSLDSGFPFSVDTTEHQVFRERWFSWCGRVVPEWCECPTRFPANAWRRTGAANGRMLASRSHSPEPPGPMHVESPTRECGKGDAASQRRGISSSRSTPDPAPRPAPPSADAPPRSHSSSPAPVPAPSSQKSACHRPACSTR